MSAAGEALPVGTVVSMDEVWLGLVIAVQDFRDEADDGDIVTLIKEMDETVWYDVVTQNLAPLPYRRSELRVATAEQVAAAHPSQLRVYAESYGVEPLIPAVSS